MKKPLFALALLLSAMHVSAGNMYTELIVGQAKYKHDTEVTPYLVRAEDLNDNTLGIRQAFRMSDSMFIEVGYHDFGESSARGSSAANAVKATMDVEALALGINGGHTLSSGLALKGRFGLTYIEADLQRKQFISDGSGDKFSNADSDINIYAGIDITYPITSNVSVGLQYTGYNMSNEFNIGGVKVEGDSLIKESALSIAFNY